MTDMNIHDLEKRLKEVRLAPSAALDERVKKTLAEARAAAQAQANTELPASGSAASITGKRAVWFSSGVHVKAAGALAACLLAGVLLWTFFGRGTTASAYTFLEKAVENSKAADWVHARVVEGSPERTEMWGRFQPFVQFSVIGERVSLMDLSEKRKYSYDPDTNTILIEPFIIVDKALTQSTSYLDALLTALKESPDVSESLEDGEEVIDGKTFRVLKVTVSGTVARIIINPELNRIVRYEARAVVEGKQVQVLAVVFDYPETGPEDIYALGVPRDAKIDNRVSEGVIAIRESEQRAREAFAATYFAIVYKGREAGDGGIEPEKINVVYKKNGRFRIEEYNALSSGESTGSYDLRQRLPADDMEAVEREISKRKYWRVYFCEPNQKLPTLVGFDDDYAIKAAYTRIGIGQFVPEGVSWPEGMPVTGTVALPGKTSGFGYLLAAERLEMGRTENGGIVSIPRRQRWFYNRDRDWVLEESTSERDIEAQWQRDKDWLKDVEEIPDWQKGRRVETRRVVEYAVTPASQWYAARVEEDIDHGGAQPIKLVTIVHLDTTREIPDTLFDPSQIESEEFFVPKEKLVGWHAYVALEEIDSREDWPETPEEVVEAYWRARNAKDYEEMSVLWPGSGAWNQQHLSAEQPTEYVFGEGRKSASGDFYIVPYSLKRHYEESGRFNFKMILRNNKSKKGRWYVESAN